jgi:hypothetical protein
LPAHQACRQRWPPAATADESQGRPTGATSAGGRLRLCLLPLPLLSLALLSLLLLSLPLLSLLLLLLLPLPSQLVVV